MGEHQSLPPKGYSWLLKEQKQGKAKKVVQHQPPGPARGREGGSFQLPHPNDLRLRDSGSGGPKVPSLREQALGGL